MDNVLKSRETNGAYHHLVQELQFNPEPFKAYFNLTRMQFEQILGRIEDDLTKINVTRKAILPRERLCLTVRLIIITE